MTSLVNISKDQCLYFCFLSLGYLEIPRTTYLRHQIITKIVLRFSGEM